MISILRYRSIDPADRRIRGRRTAMDSTKLLQDYYEVLRSCLPFSDGQPFAHDDTLTDLGLDSLSAVQLLGELEATFDISFPDDRVTTETLETVESLWLTLRSLLPAEDSTSH
jgi:acyl carrier protein